MAELIAVLVFLFLALLLGYLRGVEKERSRIYEAFRLERKYTYEDFYNVLEEHEKRKEGWKAMAKLDKQRKKHNNKKNHSN